MRIAVSILCAACVVVASPARGSSKVSVAFSDSSLSARYSQALNLELNLHTPDGAPIDGTAACPGRACALSVELRPDRGGDVVLVTEPDVFVDAAGRARARLTLVDGRHGDARFESAPEGLAHTLTVRFRGAGVPLPDVTDPECAAAAADVIDGRLCPATATATLLIFPEVPALEFAQDVEMGLQETVTLFASIADETGDADVAGDAIDGRARKRVGASACCGGGARPWQAMRGQAPKGEATLPACRIRAGRPPGAARAGLPAAAAAAPWRHGASSGGPAAPSSRPSAVPHGPLAPNLPREDDVPAPG
jgi:hypothetical protein